MIDTHAAIIGASGAGEVALDLERLIGSHACVVANAGGGKSGLIRRILETTHGQIQHIVLDIEDEFYTLRERYDYVIAGGDGGDVPATLANAEELALGALRHGFSLIVQLNDLGEDAATFVGRFLNAMIRAPRDLWHPVLVVLDETQRFAPQGGATDATHGVKALTAQGRKRGFTAILASQRIAKISADVRGDINNWILGRVGQSLDRDTMADQLGFTRKEGQERFRGMPPRTFWGFGPAIADEPVLFTSAEVETTPVKPGQAKVTTPPPPEALREILAALVPPADDEKVAATMAAPDPVAKCAGCESLTVENARFRARIKELMEREDRMYGAGKNAGIGIGLVRAREALAALPIPEIDASEDTPTMANPAAAIKGGRHEVASSAVRAPSVKTEPPAPARNGDEGIAGGSPSPAALAIADLLDRINPARVTWSQAATMTGRKASGGNFNSARKWLRASGRIEEEGDLIRSSAAAPAGMTREEAIDLWKGVLTNPAPKMINAFLQYYDLTKEGLGDAIGAAPRGGNFNNGLAQLRRNGLLYDYGSGTMRLAEPLPGEAT